MAAAAAVQQPVSAQVVGNAFVQQYYEIQHQSPSLVHKFYQDISKVGRPDDDGSMSFTTTLPAINEVILALNYGEYRAEIKSVDSEESYNGGVHVLVTGDMAGKDNIVRNFTQTFFLAPQEKGFFVLNDIFRYKDIKQQLDNPAPTTDVDVAPVTPEQVVDPTPVPEAHVPEQSVVPAVSNGEVEDQIPSDNEEEVSVAEVVDAVPEDPVPVAKVVDEVPDDSQLVSESNARIEEVPKKSYASISAASSSSNNDIAELKAMITDLSQSMNQKFEELSQSIRRGQEKIEQAAANMNQEQKELIDQAVSTLLQSLPPPPVGSDAARGHQTAQPKEPVFSCPLCMGPLVEETSTRCGHIFCKKCIKTAVSAQGKCPTCRRDITRKDTIKIYLPTTE